MSLVLGEENYKPCYCSKFPKPTKPAVYDETIPNNAMNCFQAKAEAVHKEIIADYLLFATTERETRDFILAVIEDTWVRKLREPITFYITVSPFELISHLQTICGGLHALNVLDLQNEIQHYHLDMEGIPEYINALEDAQKQSKRAVKQITAENLLLIVSNVMLASERFPRAEESWEDLTKNEKDWAAWKNLYKAADGKAKVKNKAVAGQYQFGASHSALRNDPHNTPPENDLYRSASNLDEYFDALAAASTT